MADMEIVRQFNSEVNDVNFPARLRKKPTKMRRFISVYEFCLTVYEMFHFSCRRFMQRSRRFPKRKSPQ